jgi:hypothetical protein
MSKNSLRRLNREFLSKYFACLSLEENSGRSKWTEEEGESYGVFGPCPSSGILKNTTFPKFELFPSSCEGMGHT